MCHGGEPGRLFVHHVRDILELDCSRLQFKEIQAIPTSINACRNLTYVSSPHNLIVAIDGNCREITAISTHSKETVWTVDEIDGKEIYVAIRAIVFSPTHNAILVGVLEKIFVLNPVDGSHIQTIPLPGMGGIFDMCFLKNRMFAIHGAPTAKQNIMFLSQLKPKTVAEPGFHQRGLVGGVGGANPIGFGKYRISWQDIFVN